MTGDCSADPSAEHTKPIAYRYVPEQGPVSDIDGVDKSGAATCRHFS